MKRTLYLSFVFLISAITTSAQTPVIDSAVMGSGYANEVYYSLLNGKVLESPVKNWDIAINTTRFDVVILANHANGVTVYNYAKGDTSKWNNIDTSGINNFMTLYNSDTSWGIGAFNLTANGQPLDFSWGVYDPGSHTTTGDSLYILKLETTGNPTQYKKFWIKYKDITGLTSVRYANLDGSNDTTVIISSDDASLYNFTWFSLRNNTKVSREPNKNSWDLTFTRWWDEAQQYLVTGVLSNKGVMVAEAQGVKTADAVYDNFKNNTSTSMSAIGWEWKVLNSGFGYDIVDSLCYFVRAKDKKLWKVRFTEFSGTSRGTTVFEKTLISDPNSVKNLPVIPSFEVYPNPASGNTQVIFEPLQPGSSSAISITDLSGRQLLQYNIEQTNALQVQAVDISALNRGVYFVTITNSGSTATKKLLVL